MTSTGNTKRVICRRELFGLPPEDEDQRSDELRYSGRAKEFLIVPDELVFSGRALTHAAKVMWLAIYRHSWHPDPNKRRACFPGRERLAAICGISPRQATRCLKELRKKGLLRTIRRLDKTSLYLLGDPPKGWMRRTKRELARIKRAQRERSETRRREKPEQFSRQNGTKMSGTDETYLSQ